MSSNIRVNSITPSVGNNVAIGTAGGTITFNCDTISGIATFANDIDITQKLDVDGHAELDNVNISGVVTSTSFVGPVTGNVTGNLTGNVTGNTSGTAGGLTGSPSISVTNITASGNVSIAGTLTYEDVTNIDAVGVVTARSGIDIVGGSKKLNFDSGASGVFELYRESSGNAYIRATNQLRIQSGDRISFYKIGGPDFLVLDTTGNIVTGNTNIIGNVGISSAVPKTDLDVSTKTGAVALPQGTTAQRPSGSAPYIRKNSTNNALEFYNGTEWVEIITDYFPTGSTILG